MKFVSRFEKVTPEEAGIRAEDIRALLSAYTDGDIHEEVHAFVLLHRGRLVAEGAFSPFRMEERHELFSGTKMLVGAAVGFAEAEGVLSEEERVADIFPALLPEEPSEELLSLRIRHLLSMTLGMEGQAVHTLSTLKADERPHARLRAILARKFVHAPGEVFSYDNEASYLLSAIITQKTGLTLEEYLAPRLFEPLGIETPSFGKDNDGINYGYIGARLSIEEYALLGELYRMDGVYGGKRILPEGFVKKATAKRIDTPPSPGADWGEGYASHFWLGRHGSFRFCGAFGQMCAVFPERELVFAVFSGADYFNIPHVLEKFYDKLLARISPAPLPARKDTSLDRFTKDLSLPYRLSHVPPTLPLFEETPFTVTPSGSYTALRLSHASDSLTLTLDGSVKISLGLRAPVRTVIEKAKTRFPYPTERHDTVLSASAYFESTDLLIAHLRVIGAPYALILRLSLSEKTAVFTPLRFM